MKLIELTNGEFAKVDDDVYEWASKMKWCWGKEGVRNTKSGKYLHRLIMSASKGELVDHGNHDTKDNQRENLRLCTKSENGMNRIIETMHLGKVKQSKYKGVGRSGKNWGARIWIEGKEVQIGTFPTERRAALAYNYMARLHYGKFALLNNVDEEV